jgi:hypothetical protein
MSSACNNEVKDAKVEDTKKRYPHGHPNGSTADEINDHRKKKFIRSVPSLHLFFSPEIVYLVLTMLFGAYVPFSSNKEVRRAYKKEWCMVSTPNPHFLCDKHHVHQINSPHKFCKKRGCRNTVFRGSRGGTMCVCHRQYCLNTFNIHHLLYHI